MWRIVKNKMLSFLWWINVYCQIIIMTHTVFHEWMYIYFIIKETLLVNHNDISGGFFIKFSFLLGISTHTPDRYVY